MTMCFLKHLSFDLIPMSAVSSHHLFSSNRWRAVLSRKLRCSIHLCMELYVRLVVRNKAITSSNDIVPSLTTAAPLEFCSVAQTECAPISHSARFSNELKSFANVLSPKI